MKKTKKRFLSVLLVLSCFMAMHISALAAESAVPVAEEVSVIPASSVDESDASINASERSIYGYAADYTDNEADDFYVNATGSYSLTGGATIKSSDFASSTQITYVNIYRPDGSLAVSNVKLTGNQEKVVNFTNAQVGNYRIAYNVNGINKGWIHCWIY